MVALTVSLRAETMDLKMAESMVAKWVEVPDLKWEKLMVELRAALRDRLKVAPKVASMVVTKVL